MRGFEILGALREVQTMATSGGIRELPRLIKQYGRGRWRKLKAVASIRLSDGSVRDAEIHGMRPPA